MKAEGLSVRQLARELDVSSSTVQAWRTGRKRPGLGPWHALDLMSGGACPCAYTCPLCGAYRGDPNGDNDPVPEGPPPSGKVD